MADQDETTTRDLDTLGEDGPDLTRFETPSARGVQEQRPSYSPVAQPGMNEEIWFHTVETDRKARRESRRPTRGMISRLHGERKRSGGGG